MIHIVNSPEIEQINYNGHKLGGNNNGLCDIAEFRHIKAMALFLRDKKGVRGVNLYDPNRREIISQGLRIEIYDKNTIHLVTGLLKNTLAIEELKLNPKLRVRPSFPNIKNLKSYPKREIELSHPNHEVLEWAFNQCAINYDYEKLFSVLLPLVIVELFNEALI